MAGSLRSVAYHHPGADWRLGQADPFWQVRGGLTEHDRPTPVRWIKLPEASPRQNTTAANTFPRTCGVVVARGSTASFVVQRLQYFRNIVSDRQPHPNRQRVFPGRMVVASCLRRRTSYGQHWRMVWLQHCGGTSSPSRLPVSSSPRALGWLPGGVSGGLPQHVQHLGLGLARLCAARFPRAGPVPMVASNLAKPSDVRRAPKNPQEAAGPKGGGSDQADARPPLPPGSFVALPRSVLWIAS